jgi:hypothetical protein
MKWVIFGTFRVFQKSLLITLNLDEDRSISDEKTKESERVWNRQCVKVNRTGKERNGRERDVFS